MKKIPLLMLCFLVLSLLSLSNVFGLRVEGDSLFNSNYTYEDYLDMNMLETYSYIFEKDNVLYIIGMNATDQTAGIKKILHVYTYNPSTETLSNHGYYDINLTSGESRVFPLYYDDYTDILYFNTNKLAGGDPGSYAHMHSYTFDQILQDNPNPINYNYNVCPYQTIYLTRYGNEMLRINNNIPYVYFICTFNTMNSSISRLDDSGLLIDYEDKTFTSTIIDSITDGQYIYVLTLNEMLYKIDYELNTVQSKNISSYISIPATGTYYYFYDFLRYNSGRNSILVWKDNNEFSEFDTNLIYEDTYSTNTHTFLSTSSYVSPYHIGESLFYITHTSNISVCDYSDYCEIIELRNQITDDDLSYMEKPVSDGYIYSKNSRKRSLIFDDSLYYRSGQDIIRLSGFIDMELFDDDYYYTISVSNTSLIEGESVDVDVFAYHNTAQSSMRYAYNCDYSNTYLFKQYFTEFSEFNDNTSFTTTCNDESVTNYFGLPFYGMDLTNCSTGYFYDLNVDSGKQFTFNTLITQFNNTNITISLYDNTLPFLNLTLEYDNDNEELNVYNNGSVIYTKTINNNILYTFPYDDRNIYNFKIMLSLYDGTYRMSAYDYGESNGTWTEEYNLLRNASTLKSYNISGSLGQIHQVDTTTEYYPILTTSSTKTCQYNEQGTYNLCVYVTTERQEDYQERTCYVISVAPFEIVDIGNVFDDVMTSEEFGAGFWKFLMFLCFTALIFVGVGFFNFDRSREFGVMFVEFLFGMTFMLFIMSYYLRFFPLYYFISVLIVDTMVLVYYIKKVFE